VEAAVQLHQLAKVITPLAPPVLARFPPPRPRPESHIAHPPRERTHRDKYAVIAKKVLGRESRTKSLKRALALLPAIVIPYERDHHLSLSTRVRPVRDSAGTSVLETTGTARLVAPIKALRLAIRNPKQWCRLVKLIDPDLTRANTADRSISRLLIAVRSATPLTPKRE